MNIKVGNIYKIKHKNMGVDYINIGICCEAMCNEYGHKVYDFITREGDVIRRFEDGIVEVKSTRISPELRKAFVEALKAYKFKWSISKKIDKLTEEKDLAQKAFNETIDNIKNATGYLGWDEFISKAEDLFSGVLKEGYIHVSSLCRRSGEEAITINQSVGIEKWASPEEYSFIYREYDGNCFIRENDEYKEALEEYRYKVPLNSKVQSMNAEKPRIYLSLGDKGTLSINRPYTLNIKGGPTQENFEKIKNKLKEG